MTHPNSGQPEPQKLFETQSVEWLLQIASDEATRQQVIQRAAIQAFGSTNLEKVSEVYIDRQRPGLILVTDKNRVYAVDGVTGSIRAITQVRMS